MNEALLALQMVNAAIVAGVNLSTFIGKLSTQIEQRHAAGSSLQREDLDVLFAEGDVLEREALARVKAAMPAPAAAP